MKKNNITSISFACLISFPILSIFSGIGTFNIIKNAKVDAHLSTIIAFLLGFFIIKLFFIIFNYKGEYDILDKNKLLFGKTFGSIINYLINICYLLIGTILLYNISNFAISQFLAETPMIIFMILFGIILVYSVMLGIENIARSGIIFFMIIFFLTILSTSGIISHFKIDNIKPFLETGINPPIKGGISLLLTNITPIFLLLIVEKDKIDKTDKLKKEIIFFYFLAFLFLFLAIILTIGSLGIELSSIYQYPEYTVLKKVSLFDFIERIENFIYVKWIFSTFITLTLIIYHIKSTIKKDNKIIIPSLILTTFIILSNIIFKNNTIFYYVIYHFLPFICLTLLFLYLLISISILLKTKN